MENPPAAFVDWRAAVFDNPSAEFISESGDGNAEISSFVFDLRDYTKIRLLGSGGSADVSLYEHRSTHEQIAVKILRAGLADTDRLRVLFVREALLLRKLIHPCICRLRGVSLPTDGDSGLIATEYIPKGSLRTILDDRPRWFTPTSRIIVLAGIVIAMIYVHAQGIMHRDLKPENTLLDENGRPRICDFGTGKSNDGSPNTANFGTVMYMAPEMYDVDETYNEKVDVYAFAMIMFEVIVGMLPFDRPGRETFWSHVLFIKRGGRRAIPSAVKRKTATLIEACWAQAPNDRPSFADVFKTITEMNFQLMDGIEIADVYRFLEWTAGRHV
jgi:serine/threonine protein kinase